MTDSAKAYSTGTKVAELLHLFGPTPVLSSENIGSYQQVMAQFLEDFAPRDFIEELLIKELADSTWEAARYARYKTLLMERRFRDRLEYQARRGNATAQSKVALAEKPPVQNGWLSIDPDDVLDELLEEVDAILLKPAAELDHFHAVEVGLVYYEHLDNLFAAAVARRNNALNRIERYRAGFSHSLRQVSDKIIEAQCK
jgi:hypothetical protein